MCNGTLHTPAQTGVTGHGPFLAPSNAMHSRSINTWPMLTQTFATLPIGLSAGHAPDQTGISGPDHLAPNLALSCSSLEALRRNRGSREAKSGGLRTCQQRR